MVIYTPVISGSLIISGSIVTTSGGLPLTGSLVSSGSFTSIGPTIVSGSLTVITGSSIEFQVLDTGVRIGNLATDNHNITGSLRVSGSITGSGFLTTGTITAQTLVVQTITSSVSNITGSTKFGSIIGNTHQFTGSVLVSGSLGIGTSPSSPLDVVADNSTAINLRLRGRVLDNVGQMEFWNNAQSTRYGYIATDSVSMGIVTTQNLPLVLGTNSTERMRISGSNVGIGTTNPISQFHINGSTGGTFTDGLRINRNGNANQYTVINHVGGASNFMTVDTSGNNIAEMYFQRSINGTAATSSMMINTNGNVGIGMTNPTTARLQIQTSGNGLSYSSPFYSCDNSTYQNGFLISHLDGLTRLMTTYTGTGINCDMTFWTTLSNGNQGERMRITAGGNVLIGIDRVFGINTADGTDNGYLALCGAGADGPTRGGHIYLSGNERGSDPGTVVLSAGNVSGGSVIVRTGAGTERMRIDSSGNVTFGVTSAYDTALIWRTDFTSTVHGRIYATGLPRVVVVAGESGGVQLTSGATSWTSNSDERLKNINGEIENALNKLLTLRAVNFSWKSDLTNKENLGLIAQDVEEQFPQIVDKTELPKYGEEEQSDKTEYLGVRYTEMIPVLVKAIQELKAENDTLKEILQRNNIQ